MLQAGEIRELVVVKETSFGVYLAEEAKSADKVLLPKKEKDGAKAGDVLQVFLYRDSSDRMIATRRTPVLTLGKTAVLKVKDVLSDLCASFLRLYLNCLSHLLWQV